MTFTTISIMFLPPGMIAGIFGMNVIVPFMEEEPFYPAKEYDEDGNPLPIKYEWYYMYIRPYFPFFGIVLLSICISFCIYCCFK